MTPKTIITTASTFVSTVVALGKERQQGYANREHGHVLNGRIADKVVNLQEEGEAIKSVLDAFLVDHERMEAQLNEALKALSHYAFEVQTPDDGKMAKDVLALTAPRD